MEAGPSSRVVTASLSFPRPQPVQRVAYLQAMHETMLAYLKAKVEDADWHGVQDAASDLREIEAELKGLKHE